MNEFDRKQISLLKPLRENNVILYFSFYANTFPIAYHYNFQINNIVDSKRLIKFHDWNKTFPSVSSREIYKLQRAQNFLAHGNDIDNLIWDEPKNINLFYTSHIENLEPTSEQITPFKLIKDQIEYFNAHELIDELPFTNYCPRFVFLNNNLYTRNIISKKKEADNIISIDNINFKNFDSIKKQYPSFENIIHKCLEDGINTFNIYTDIEIEAKIVIGNYLNKNDITVNFFDKYVLHSLNLQEQNRNESKTLDLYFYGAPTSFHFLSRTERFIPVALNLNTVTANGINTIAVLHYNKKESNSIREIKGIIEEYHNNIFNEAIKVTAAESFNNIRLAYNKYARLIRHDSYFYSPQSFANCIALHHNYGQSTLLNQKISYKKHISIPKNHRENFHIHYGAGKLGIGLVLPLINTDTTNLVVLQKNRKDWENKINLNLNTIILSNDKHWWKKFQLFNANNFHRHGENNLLFVLFESFLEIIDLFSRASSISYSLNNQDEEVSFLDFLCNKVNFENEKIFLFPFENNSFKRNPEISRQELLLKNKKINDINVKADRICIEREIKFNNKVNVRCESHLEVILNVDEKLTNKLFADKFDRNSQLIFTENLHKFEILSKRKQFLVNELHFILAVYGYDFLLSKDIVHWENQYVTIIQAVIKSNPDYYIPIETFIRLQIVRLLFLDKKRNFLQKIYELREPNCEMIYENLLSYAISVKERFNNSKEDQISRVFNTNDITSVEKKYNSIILEIERFVFTYKDYIQSLPLFAAGTALEYQKLIFDIKNRLDNIFEKNKKGLDEAVKQKQRERSDKLLELKLYRDKIESLTNNRKTN